jgi:hypothetical protein
MAKQMRGKLARRLLNPKKARVVNSLLRKDVKDIVYTGDTLEFTYDNHRLKYKVVKQRHVPWVGYWNHGKKNIIYYDDDVLPHDRLPLLIHEGVESYAAKRRHLDPTYDAHYVAGTVEERLIKRLGINADNYGSRIERIYRMEMPRHRPKRNYRYPIA